MFLHKPMTHCYLHFSGRVKLFKPIHIYLVYIHSLCCCRNSPDRVKICTSKIKPINFFFLTLFFSFLFKHPVLELGMYFWPCSPAFTIIYFEEVALGAISTQCSLAQSLYKKTCFSHVPSLPCFIFKIVFIRFKGFYRICLMLYSHTELKYTH